MSKITLGIVAHVDAGKTTLSEAILYKMGVIRKLGRVDNGDSYMDTDEMEKNRGITIYSKLARIPMGEDELIFIDTPGHVDFSAEMERSLNVLDVAVLVVSGINGVQSHTRTLWKLLKQYNIPTLIFVNKMDITPKTKDELLEDIGEILGSECIDFSGYLGDMDLAASDKEGESDGSDVIKSDVTIADIDGDLAEELGMCSEKMMEEYLENGILSSKSVIEAILARQAYPVLFGTALKDQGVNELLNLLKVVIKNGQIEKGSEIRQEEFGAKCFKISRDKNNTRETWVRITSGVLKSKDMLQPFGAYPSDARKVNEIRKYSGDKYELVQEAYTGDIVALTGSDNSACGMGFGACEDGDKNILQPVLSYRVLVEKSDNVHEVYNNLKELNEEDPALEVEYLDSLGVINIHLMGKVQLEIIKAKMLERFDKNIDFGTGTIMYKETITDETLGHGHFEPLRHFADVVLNIKPLPPNSGIVVHSDCPVDVLGRNYQHQVLNYLSRKNHPGILTGSNLTDLEITIISGKSHTKHTEGGDFRKATDIAIRDGLLKVENVLLEPYYKVILELPVNNVGRAMTDLERMHGEIMPPDMRDDICILSGRVPVATIIDYAAEVASYTGGMGQIMFEMDGYYPCHNADEVIENSTYDYTTDMRHPYQSIYVHGGGPEKVVVNDNNIDVENVGNTTSAGSSKRGGKKSKKNSDYTGYGGLEPDLDEIFTRTYGEVKFVNHNQAKVIDADAKKQENVKQAREEYNRAHPKQVEKKENVKVKKKYILVDCYNVIHADKKMGEMANENLDAARGALLDMLCNYQGFMGCDLIAVFDAYKVSGNTTTTSKYNNIYVVYTKENQTADAYIERTTHEMVNKENADVTVISSDGLVQRIIMGDGARRVSARDFFEEMERLHL